jgi:hypothetical protein
MNTKYFSIRFHSLWHNYSDATGKIIFKRAIRNQWVVWVGTEWSDQYEYGILTGRFQIIFTLANFSLIIGIGKLKNNWGLNDDFVNHHKGVLFYEISERS